MMQIGQLENLYVVLHDTHATEATRNSDSPSWPISASFRHYRVALLHDTRATVQHRSHIAVLARRLSPHVPSDASAGTRPFFPDWGGNELTRSRLASANRAASRPLICFALGITPAAIGAPVFMTANPF